MTPEEERSAAELRKLNAEAAKLEAEARKLAPETTKLEAEAKKLDAEARRQRHGTVTDDAKLGLAAFAAGIGALKVAESLGWL